MTPNAVLALIDGKCCLSFLARTVQHKSYTHANGARSLARLIVREMQGRVLSIVDPGSRTRVA
jgi:hypothetical protein